MRVKMRTKYHIRHRTHLFVCGLNIVCCSSSIAVKKSIIAFWPGVFAAESAAADELAPAGGVDNDAVRYVYEQYQLRLFEVERTLLGRLGWGFDTQLGIPFSGLLLGLVFNPILLEVGIVQILLE